MKPGGQSTSGSGADDDGDLKLGLIIGIPAAALLIVIIATIIMLWRMDKLKCCCAKRQRRMKEDLARREERKKSIVIIAPTGKKGAELYIARHYYKAEDENQLSLETGRIVEVQEKLESGWWRGVTGDQEGWFPATFVKKIDVSDPNCSLQHSVSSTPDRTRHPPPPTGRPPIDQRLSTDADIYVNTAFEADHPDTDMPVVHKSDDTDSEHSVSERAEKNEELLGIKVASDKDIDVKLEGMKKEDIEGYLNEIFTVEDETPETIRRNEHRQSKNKDIVCLEGSNKKLKDEQNEILAKEQSDLSNKKMGTTSGRKGRSKKANGSPLINPEHYMISSTESLFSASSCNDDEDTAHRQQGAVSQSETDVTDRVYDEPDNGQTKDNPDVHRGAPDGSSLVGILPDGHKELSLERNLTLDEDVHKNEADDDLYEKVSNTLLMKNLENELKSTSAANKQVYVAMYAFVPTEPNQLTLSSNDVISSLGHEENGWMKGKKISTGEIGWFPISYVREGKAPCGADILSEESEGFDSEGEFEDDDNMTGLEYRALYPYTAQQDGDLTFAEGDIIIVLETLDNGWWRGYLGEKEGWFPGTYVEPVPQTPASSSVYEDVASPLEMVAPAHTSSPLNNSITNGSKEYKTQKADTLPVTENVETIRMKQAEMLGDQQTTAKQKKSMLSPLNMKFKPHVPRRFIKPKLVKLPKQTTNNVEGASKPSRPPPPPVPKADDSLTESRGSASMEMTRNAVSQNQRVASQTNDYKKKSLPRPKEPPPPAPILVSSSQKEADTSYSANKTLNLKDGMNGPVQAGSIIEQHDYDDVEPTEDQKDICSSDFLQNDFDEDSICKLDPSKLDSGLGADSTLPRVHTSARTESSSTSRSSTVVSPGSSSMDNQQHEKLKSVSNSATVPGEEEMPSLKGIGTILDIFEKIVHKVDQTTVSSREYASDDDDGDQDWGPEESLPEKQEENKTDFRRTCSEPNLGELNSSSLSLLEPGSEHKDKKQDSSLQDFSAGYNISVTKEVKVTGSKPSLPPRPMVPSLRSRSLGSLVTVKGSEDSEPTSERINTSVTKDKPEKPPLPTAIVKGMNKEQSKKAAEVPSVVQGRTASEARKTIFGQGSKPVSGLSPVSVVSPVQQVRVEKIAQKKDIIRDDVQVKSTVTASEEQSGRPPRPSQPPVKVVTKLMISSNSRQTEKVITENGQSASNQESKVNKHLHQLPTITLISETKKTSITNGDKTQRQKILSNGSLKMSNSPETSIKHLNSSRDRKLSQISANIPSLAKSEVSDQSDGSQPPPLPTYPPPELTTSESDISGSGNGRTKSSDADLQHASPPSRRLGTSTVNIRTSPLRFFTPVGFSRSGSSVGTSPSNVSVSSPADSTKNSLGADASPEPLDDAHHCSLETVNGEVSSAEPLDKPSYTLPSSSLSAKKTTSPLQFYTPKGFSPQTRRTSVDSATDHQRHEFIISASDQNLADQSANEETKKCSSTSSLDHVDKQSTHHYQPYAGIQLKPTLKKTLTPPRPFIPSRWSAYHGFQKGILPLAMVNIEIDDDSSTFTDKKERGHISNRSGGNNPLTLISQADLESDV